MEIQDDFKELLELFNSHKVEYLIVGAYARAAHGAPRYTGDLDIWVHATDDNAIRILAALKAFGFGSLELSANDFSQPKLITQLGVPPLRVDILTTISGVTWDESEPAALAGTYAGVPVRYIGKDAYVKNKLASGRLKDLADAAEIQE